MPYKKLSISGPIVIIEDDADDQFIFNQIFEEFHIADKAVFFSNPIKAYQYLKDEQVQPFIVISDINLPIQSGIELKRQMDQDPALRRKCIPFVFLSTSIDRKSVDKAYQELTIQGFFQKSPDYDQLKHRLHSILDYWQQCQHPNSA